MQRDFILYLYDIIESINEIEEFMKNVKDIESFQDNKEKLRAVERDLEIIGEAVKKIPEDLKDMESEIEWKKISGFRDVLAHGYFGIDVSIIWDIIQNKLNPLKISVQKIIQSVEKKPGI